MQAVQKMGNATSSSPPGSPRQQPPPSQQQQQQQQKEHVQPSPSSPPPQQLQEHDQQPQPSPQSPSPPENDELSFHEALSKLKELAHDLSSGDASAAAEQIGLYTAHSVPSPERRVPAWPHHQDEGGGGGGGGGGAGRGQSRNANLPQSPAVAAVPDAAPSPVASMIMITAGGNAATEAEKAQVVPSQSSPFASDTSSPARVLESTSAPLLTASSSPRAAAKDPPTCLDLGFEQAAVGRTNRPSRRRKPVAHFLNEAPGPQSAHSVIALKPKPTPSPSPSLLRSRTSARVLSNAKAAAASASNADGQDNVAWKEWRCAANPKAQSPRSPSGKRPDDYYWYNTVTRAVQWEHPKDGIVDEPTSSPTAALKNKASDPPHAHTVTTTVKAKPMASPSPSPAPSLPPSRRSTRAWSNAKTTTTVTPSSSSSSSPSPSPSPSPAPSLPPSRTSARAWSNAKTATTNGGGGGSTAAALTLAPRKTTGITLTNVQSKAVKQFRTAVEAIKVTGISNATFYKRLKDGKPAKGWAISYSGDNATLSAGDESDEQSESVLDEKDTESEDDTRTDHAARKRQQRGGQSSARNRKSVRKAQANGEEEEEEEEIEKDDDEDKEDDDEVNAFNMESVPGGRSSLDSAHGAPPVAAASTSTAEAVPAAKVCSCHKKKCTTCKSCIAKHCMCKKGESGKQPAAKKQRQQQQLSPVARKGAQVKAADSTPRTPRSPTLTVVPATSELAPAPATAVATSTLPAPTATKTAAILCNECSATFKKQSGLDKHVRSKHTLYCVCRKAGHGAMTECIGCLEWFHDSCVGLTAKTRPSERWRCAPCAQFHPPPSTSATASSSIVGLLASSIKVQNTVAPSAATSAGAKANGAEGVGLPALPPPLMYSFEWKGASDPKIELKPGMKLSVFFETNSQSFRGTVLSTSADDLDFEVNDDDGYVEIQYADGEVFNKCLYKDEWPFKVFATDEEIKAAANAAADVAAASAAVLAAKAAVAAANAAAAAAAALPASPILTQRIVVAPKNDSADGSNAARGSGGGTVLNADSNKRKVGAVEDASSDDEIDTQRRRAPALSVKASALVEVALPKQHKLPPQPSSSAALLAAALASWAVDAATAAAAAVDGAAAAAAAPLQLQSSTSSAAKARPVDQGGEQDSTPWPIAQGKPPPHPWKICIDPATKDQYYFNPKTGRSLWTLQGALNAVGTPVVIKAVVPAPWEEYVNPRTLRPYYYNPTTEKTVDRFQDIPVADAEVVVAATKAAEAAVDGSTDKKLSADQIDAALTVAALGKDGNPRKRPPQTKRLPIDRYQLAPPLYQVEYTAEGLPIKRRMLGRKRPLAAIGDIGGAKMAAVAAGRFGKHAPMHAPMHAILPTATASHAKMSAWHKDRVGQIMQKQQQTRHDYEEEGEEKNGEDGVDDDDDDHANGANSAEISSIGTEGSVGASTAAAPLVMSKQQQWADARSAYTSPDLYHVGNNRAVGQREQVAIRKQMTLCCLQKQGRLHSRLGGAADAGAGAGAGGAADNDVAMDEHVVGEPHALLACSSCAKSFHCICAGIESKHIETLADPWECAICFASRTFLCNFV